MEDPNGGIDRRGIPFQQEKGKGGVGGTHNQIGPCVVDGFQQSRPKQRMPSLPLPDAFIVVVIVIVVVGSFVVVVAGVWPCPMMMAPSAHWISSIFVVMIM